MFVLLSPVDVDVLDHIRLPNTALVGERDLDHIDDGERLLTGVSIRPALQQRNFVVHYNISPSLGELLGEEGWIEQSRLVVCKYILKFQLMASAEGSFVNRGKLYFKK